MPRTLDDLIDERVNQKIEEQMRLQSLPGLPEPPNPTVASQIQRFFTPQIPKTPTDLLPSIVPGSKIITDPLKAGGKVIADNPAGAAKAIPAVLGTGASVAAGMAATPLLLGAGAVGAAGAAGSYLKNKALQALDSPDAMRGNADVGYDALKEGGMMAASELLPAGLAKAKPLIKEYGLGAIDTLASLPQGTAKTGYENTKLLASGMADKYVPAIKRVASSLANLVKDSAKKVKDEYGAAVEKVAAKKGGRPSISAPKLDESLSNLARKADVGKEGIKLGSDEVRTQIEKLREDFFAETAKPVKRDVIEKGAMGDQVRHTIEQPEIRGNVPLEKALTLRQKLGELADWAAATPGQGKQSAAIKEAYNEITAFIHKHHPEIEAVDKQYKNLIESTGYLRKKLGIVPGDEATPLAAEKIETLVKGINNPGKKETIHEAIDTVSKELGKNTSVVKRAAEINAMKEFGPIFPRRKSLNVLGGVGKVIDAALTPFTGPRAMATYLRGAKTASKYAGKVPGKTKAAQTGLKALFGYNKND